MLDAREVREALGEGRTGLACQRHVRRPGEPEAAVRSSQAAPSCSRGPSPLRQGLEREAPPYKPASLLPHPQAAD